MFLAKAAATAAAVNTEETMSTAHKFGFPSHMWTQYTQTGKGAGWGLEVGNQRVVMRSW